MIISSCRENLERNFQSNTKLSKKGDIYVSDECGLVQSEKTLTYRKKLIVESAQRIYGE